MLSKLAATVVIACAATCLSVPAAAGYSQLFVFGDSLSDAGNVFLATGGVVPRSPPYAGRFTNGPVAVEVLATKLGVPLAPSLSGGTDYAFGGASTAFDNFYLPALTSTGIRAQVTSFASAAPAFDPTETLFVLWGGFDDLLSILGSPSPPAPGVAIAAAVDNLALAAAQLDGSGARHVLVPNMLNLGATPWGMANAPALTAITQAFNARLASTMSALDGGLAADIQVLDVFSVLEDVRTNPASYGLTNVTDPCLSAATPPVSCANPDEYLFWDDVHPTAAGHSLLGSSMDAQVSAAPEPTSLALLAIGLAAIAWVAHGGARRRILARSWIPVARAHCLENSTSLRSILTE